MSKRFFVTFLLVALAIAGVQQVVAQDEITLVVWDTFSRDADLAIIEQLNAEFMEAHPGVTIVHEGYGHDELNLSLPLALGDGSGPDVAQVNQGYTAMGPLVEAGLLMPLDDFAEEFGWWDRYATTLHRRNSFTDDGSQHGAGTLYGMSNAAEIVGVFYHKAMFAEHDFAIPETFAEFEAIVAELSEAGITPIVFGSLDGWPAIHEFGAIQHAFTTSDELDSFIFRLEDGTFDSNYNLQAAETLLAWVEAGYFSEGFAGMDYDNQTTGAFVNGDGAMWITGNWMAPTIIAELGEETVGFFPVPTALEDAAPLNIGGVNLAYGIRTGTENPELAAEYIDFITGPRAAEVLLENGALPAAAVDAEVLTPDTLTADIVNAWQTISSGNAVGHYLDWTLPDIAANIQELMAARVTPEEFVAAVQSDYEALD
jgi:raffinose/stachyose/melibiose transport system substrate-binding protein